MSTRGVTDIVFCIDASESMQPCIDGVREHVLHFIQGLESGQRAMDWRIDFLASSCDEGGTAFPLKTVRLQDMGLIGALYGSGDRGRLFTRDVAEFRTALHCVGVKGDEATLVALDCALDFPWRPRNQCHRVVICLTDEPFETGAAIEMQRARLPALIEKIQKLGIILFLIGPESAVYDDLACVQRSEYRQVPGTCDGLRSVDFAEVLGAIGKSVSTSRLQGGAEADVSRGLFGQASWVGVDTPIRGR
jgi:hypothetical protein